ncbi:MAG TPA: TIGR03618 family F420-dependent PPOX class oxidoreductase [Actinomycetota bacterium]|nr:TIGR03618 family F420-dependent PPOX class oxidoreductase [Actinomycetota bacterium]
MSPKVDVSMTPDEVVSFLREPRTGVLSTLGPDGGPHSAGMWFVLREADDVLWMWTYGKSQKAVNARRDPRAVFLVEDGMRYDQLKGVSIRGRLEVVTDTESIADIGMALYERYTLPATGVRAEDGPEYEIRRQATKRVGLVLPLSDVASWDHSRL